MKLKFLIVFFLLIQSCWLFGQVSYLDSTFNPAATKGKKSFNFSPNDKGSAVTVDLAGRVIMVAYDTTARRVFVTRLKPNADFDSTFGSFGVYTNTWTFSQSAHCIVRQPDGKLLIGGGRRNTASTPIRAMVFRLNSDGTLDTGFGNSGVAVYDVGGINQEVKKIEMLGDGTIMVGGISSLGLFVGKLRQDGSIDTGFNSPSGIVQKGPSGINFGGMSINSDNEILLAGNYFSAPAQIFLYKFRSNGSIDLGFNNSGSDTLMTGSYNYSTGGVKYLPGGKFIMGFETDDNFFAMRFNSNGSVDSTFGFNGQTNGINVYGGSINNLLIDTKGNIILTGVHTYYNFGAFRFNFNGTIDSSFASNGSFSDNVGGYPGYCYGSCLTAENKIFLVGVDNGSNTLISKIENRQVSHILGNDYVLPGSSETYEVKVPSNWSFNYRWEYTGSGYFFVPDSIGQKVIIYYTSEATGGKLTCYAYIGAVTYAKTEMEVKVNNNPSVANLLAEVECAKEVTDCYNNYISQFKLNLISNDSTTCNSTGYSDFTRSQWVDTLIAGSVYSVYVRTESSDPLKYASLWIDYNNDGYFDSTSEFIGQTFSEGSTLTIQNIILKNKDEYIGPKRLRIRCNPYGFSSGQACPVAGEVGETEDYLIIIKEVDKLEAPEIITPNEDGKNDFFVIRGVDPNFSNSLSIFDRYGKEIFISDNYENNWNGKSKDGEKVIPGTYYYYFKNNDSYIRGFIEVRY